MRLSRYSHLSHCVTLPILLHLVDCLRLGSISIALTKAALSLLFQGKNPDFMTMDEP
jgi:hypothetical protein